VSTHTVRGDGPPIFDGPPVVQDAPPASSITIQGVPASVPRADVVRAIECLGIDPAQVVGLSFDLKAVHVEVCSDGKPDAFGWRWTHNGKEVATHRLTIPILEKDETP
jgi:hypothetical protein